MADLHIGPLSLIGEARGPHVHARVLGAGVPGSRPLCGNVVLRDDEWSAVERFTERMTALEHLVADMQRGATSSADRSAALRAALIRQMWKSVFDQAQCTCAPNDVCPECDAMLALGVGRWVGHEIAQKQLEQLTKGDVHG